MIFQIHTICTRGVQWRNDEGSDEQTNKCYVLESPRVHSVVPHVSCAVAHKRRWLKIKFGFQQIKNPFLWLCGMPFWFCGMHGGRTITVLRLWMRSNRSRNNEQGGNAHRHLSHGIRGQTTTDFNGVIFVAPRSFAWPSRSFELCPQRSWEESMAIVCL